MTDKTDLIREIHEYVTTHGGENTATHLLVQAASAIQTQAAELEAVGAGGVQALSAAPVVDIATAGEMQAFEAWYKQDCVIEGVAAKMAAKAAWKARAMLAASPTPTPTPTAEQQAAPKSAPGGPSDAEIDAFLDSPGGIEWVIADKRERYRLLVRAVLAKWAAPQQEAPKAAQYEMDKEASNVRLDIDSNSTEPEQQRDVACSLEVGQHVGNGEHQEASCRGSEDSELLKIAARNLKYFIEHAQFSSFADKRAALNCLDALAAPKAAPGEPSDAGTILAKVCDLFQIGKLARTESTILTNVESTLRFSNMLGAVERDLFQQPDLPEDDDPYAEVDDNLPTPNKWGAKDEADYVSQFKAALLARGFATPQQEAQEPALFVSAKQLAALTDPDDPDGEHGRYLPVRKTTKGLFTQALYTAPQPAPAPLSEMPYEKRKAIQEGEQIGASDAWFKARHEMLDTVDRRNVFRAGFDRGWNAALAAQGGKDA